MPSLQQFCHHHQLREAVARCVNCHQFYCRECITEHEDRILCATCLKELAKPRKKQGRIRLGFLAPVLQLFFGVLLIWFCFYAFGRMMLSIPDTTHMDFLKFAQETANAKEEESE